MTAMLVSAQVRNDLRGKKVLDIGTSNGAVAFEAEKRGADYIVAMDLWPAEQIGFNVLSQLLGSKATYVQQVFTTCHRSSSTTDLT